MRILVTANTNDNGKIYDVSILAKKINGYWCKCGGSVFFACNHDIRVIHMTEEEQAMPVYWQPGYPGKED